MYYNELSAARLLLSVTLVSVGARADVVTCELHKDFGETRTLGPLPDLNATVLDFKYCKITKIKSGDFDGLPNLQVILLSNNEIQNLDPAVFTPVNSLYNLSLDNNMLLEVPEFGKLSLFPNMTKLELNSNQISKLDNSNTFSSMVRLEQLNLEHNLIESLHPDIFKALINLKSINLHDNKITHIPDNMFHIKSLSSILLMKNPISYIAPEAIRSNELKSLYLGNNRLTHFPKNFVLHLKNASANFSIISMPRNPWQCACLLEVMAEAISSRVVTFFDSYRCKFPDAGQPSCHRPSLEEALEAPVVSINNLNKDVPKSLLLKTKSISNLYRNYLLFL